MRSDAMRVYTHTVAYLGELRLCYSAFHPIVNNIKVFFREYRIFFKYCPVPEVIEV